MIPCGFTFGVVRQYMTPSMNKDTTVVDVIAPKTLSLHQETLSALPGKLVSCASDRAVICCVRAWMLSCWENSQKQRERKGWRRFEKP